MAMWIGAIVFGLMVGMGAATAVYLFRKGIGI